MKTLMFFKESLKYLKEIGTFIPSSKSVAKKMVKSVNLKDSRCVVEFGAGTGTITSEILKNMGQESKLLCFETNKVFCDELKKISDEKLIVINESAENLSLYLEKHGFEEADCIISALPLVSLPKEVVKNVLSSVSSSLKKEGLFVQMQYSLKSLKELRELFKEVKIDITVLNLFPAFIYICKNKK